MHATCNAWRTSVMDGLHVADALMHSDATNASLFACSASYPPPPAVILGSTSASVLPSFSRGLACIALFAN